MESRCVAISAILLLPDGTDPQHASVECTLEEIQRLLGKWPETPDWLVSSLSNAGLISSTTKPIGVKPPRGIITDYPLYSALYVQPVPDFQAIARIAQAAFLVSVAILHGAATGTGPFTSAIRTAGLAVRRISRGEFLPQELMDVLDSPSSLADVIRRFEQRETQIANLQVEEKRVLYGFRSLLIDAIKARAPRMRQKSGVITRQFRRKHDPESTVPDHVVREDEFTPDDDDLEQGAAAVPESPRRTLLTMNVKASVPDTSLSAGQRQWRAKQRARAIAASAQGLMLSTDRLHLVDLESFEHTLQRHMSGEETLDEGHALGALVLCVSLLVGRPVEKLNDFAVAKHLTDLPAKISRPFLVESEAAFVLPPPPLKKAFAPPKEQANWYRPVQQKLMLPVPTGFAFGALLMRQAERLIGTQPFVDGRWIKAAEEFATQVNAREGSRITTTRIAEFLQRQILVETGDWADAALLCGTGDANARLYYYSPKHADLWGLWNRLWRGVGFGLGRRDILMRAVPPSDEAMGFCSRGCPTTEGVREMVSKLIDHCRSNLRGRRSAERTLLVHNTIALYTVIMILWHCGARAVNDPIDLSLYDPVTGFLALSDKDTDVYYASRVAWLPPVVRRQITSYRTHLRALRNAINIELPGSNELFFFDASDRPLSISLARLKAALPPDYPFRLNAQRHYHRTMLRELGVPGQVLDAYLGHGAAGQESYAMHSCFSPLRLAVELGPALVNLSEMAGWEVLDGLN